MAIIGIHNLLYSSDAEALRAMLRDILELPHVDAGDGWLIFKLPPAEIGVHPAEAADGSDRGKHQVSFMCDDIGATIRELEAKGVRVQGEPRDEGWGITVMLLLPGGVEVQLYQPRHPLAIESR